MNREYADPAMLEDGKILAALKDAFLKVKSNEAMYLFMNCLRDSVVFVPMHALLSEKDIERMKKGDTAPEGSMLFRPDILPHPSGLKFFPMFTQREQIPQPYIDSGITVLPMSVIRAVRLAEELTADSIVIDPYTQPCAIPMEAALKIETLPGGLSEEDQKALE